jgi:hypothetical protein
MQSSRFRVPAFPTVTIVLLASLALGACGDSRPATAPELHASSAHSPAMHAASAAADITPDAARDLAGLRELTARFHRFDAAAEAGWGTQITNCFEDAQLGGMGFHYGNTALIDGSVDELEPELLLYEPQKNGKLRFVAVEYIVPFTAWTAAQPPMLFGQSFHRNEAFGLWVLHVWHERENPRGIFTDWNPKVSCRYAE